MVRGRAAVRSERDGSSVARTASSGGGTRSAAAARESELARDALRKGYKVVLWLVESSGGIERGALRHLNLIAKRITGNKGSDRTKYGTHPLAPKSFVPHHM